MSGITLEQAQAKLDELLAVQLSGFLSVSINGRSYSFRSFDEIAAQINYWNRIICRLQRKAAGQVGYSVADLSSRR